MTRGDPEHDDADARIKALLVRALWALPADTRARMVRVGVVGVDAERVPGSGVGVIAFTCQLSNGERVPLCRVPVASIIASRADRN